MAESNIVIAGIIVYFILIIFVGYLMKNKNKGAEDFLVGGRSFGMFFNTGTLTACWVGGAVVIGVPGTIYACGIWDSAAQWGVLVSFGTGMCLVVAGLFYMKKMWELRLLSLGDFFYIRYGRQAGILSTILMTITFIVYIALQIVAFAKVGSSLVGLSLNYWIIISMAVICSYTILGGLWAVCLTDIIQVGIVTLSLVILTPVALHLVGGWDQFVMNIEPQKLDFFPADKTSAQAWLPWIAAWVIVGLGSITSPDLMQRAFSAKTGKVAARSALCAAVIYFIIFGIVIILSLATIQFIQIGAIDKAVIDNDPELLIPLVFQKFMPTPIIIVFLGATMAAVMSAAATANIGLAGVISKNLVKDIFVPNMGSRALMQTSRLVILCIGIIAAFVAIGLPSAYLLMSLGFDLILSCLFIPLTLGLYWKAGNGYGAIAGLLGGAIFRIVGSGMVNGFTLEGIGSPTDTWYVFTLGGPLISLSCMVVVSLITQRVNAPIELKPMEQIS